jgi:hypothetical protein
MLQISDLSSFFTIFSVLGAFFDAALTLRQNTPDARRVPAASDVGEGLKNMGFLRDTIEETELHILRVLPQNVKCFCRKSHAPTCFDA